MSKSAMWNGKITAIQIQITDQTKNRFLPLERTLENMSEAGNGDHEEIHASNNIPTRQKEFPIMENYIKTGGGYIKNTKIDK